MMHQTYFSIGRKPGGAAGDRQLPNKKKEDHAALADTPRMRDD
jgi:hypothetical protein